MGSDWVKGALNPLDMEGLRLSPSIGLIAEVSMMGMTLTVLPTVAVVPSPLPLGHRRGECGVGFPLSFGDHASHSFGGDLSALLLMVVAMAT